MIDVRYINVEKDFLEINNWWKHYNKTDLDIELLPDNGNSGLVVLVDNELIAAVFMFQTNSPIWYCDFLIANPKYRKKDREDVIVKLIDTSVKCCIRKGAKAVWCTTPHESVLDKLKKLDYKVDKKKHSIIYKHN
tara:strand:- start:1952 stop:2356 length:405 start_codon:yes stop_codon:yes gene_type:complete